jgi:hypothetical protein
MNFRKEFEYDGILGGRKVKLVLSGGDSTVQNYDSETGGWKEGTNFRIQVAVTDSKGTSCASSLALDEARQLLKDLETVIEMIDEENTTIDGCLNDGCSREELLITDEMFEE